MGKLQDFVYKTQEILQKIKEFPWKSFELEIVADKRPKKEPALMRVIKE